MLSLDILLLVLPLRSTTAGAVPWIYYYRVLLVQPLVFTSAGAAHLSTTAGAVLGLPSAGTIAPTMSCCLYYYPLLSPRQVANFSTMVCFNFHKIS